MSKNFEEEYKEYLNAQAPDLWNRIEAGVDALVASDAENVVPISAAKSKKKKRIRYENYRMIASVAACLFALVLVIPVYFLTKNTGKDAAAEAPMEFADAAIENVEIKNEENTALTEEAAPAEEAVSDVSDGITEVEITLEETEESVMDSAQGGETIGEQGLTETEQVLDGEDGMSGSSLALSGTQETDSVAEAAAEEDALPQEDMQVTILTGEEPAEGGTVYTAVKADGESADNIRLFVPSESGIIFEMNKMYNITVEQEENGRYLVVVAQAVE